MLMETETNARTTEGEKENTTTKMIASVCSKKTVEMLVSSSDTNLPSIYLYRPELWDTQKNMQITFSVWISNEMQKTA